MSITPKILYIEDDKFFLEFYRSEFSQHQIETHFANDGEAGIAKAKELLPDVILLDIILPKMDGFDVLKALKADGATRDIPVIILSTLGDQDDIDRLMKDGATKVFNKFVDLPSFVAQRVIEGMKTGFATDDPVVKEAVITSTKLSKNELDKTFQECFEQIESSISDLFQSKLRLEDLNISFIPFHQFKGYVKEIADTPGTIFIYSPITAAKNGVAILAIRRNDALSLIQVIEKQMAGKDLGLNLGDQVIEEFFNIVVNTFLTRLSTSISKNFRLEPPVVTSSQKIHSVLKSEELEKEDDDMVLFVQQAYLMEAADLNFSIFILFGSDFAEQE
jgi:CheY-like chemotaxis protein